MSSGAGSVTPRNASEKVGTARCGGVMPSTGQDWDKAAHRPKGRTPVDCGNLPFLIRRDGTWLYRGSPIGRKSMVCLFASVLKRDDDGDYLLETPVERGRIEVEDAPFVAVELDWHGEGRDQVLYLRTNVDETVAVGAEHPLRVAHDLLTCEPTPYVLVRPGQGLFPIEARISRAVYYELVALAEPGVQFGKRVLGVWSQGAFFSLGELAQTVD
ncbi:MAG: hypothetical protein B7Z76_10640 [Acidiphilium sp. 20-67-58]|nr:MAG: hypothetical protein B7Z76_10640 [Acidiphilium sp. 20-67-58]OYV81898.1 MAG: hypothetical protein B7Z64_10140 [Acidiphilium sp. 21-68-69]